MNSPIIAEIVLYAIYTGILTALLLLLLYPIALFIIFIKEAKNLLRQRKILQGYINELNRRERK